jgi:mono/diheme cytochrome c family protein
MTYQEAVNTFQTRKPLAKMPVMVRGTIPVDGGLEELRKVNIATLHNPLPSTPETIADGKLRYSYYCIQCHGPKADGCGTVGQSFAPLPTDLRTDDVQGESDGSLFYKISMGFLRHPPLSATIAVRDRWAIITYLRSHDLRAW